MHRHTLASIVAVVTFASSPALAQESAWGDNGYVSFNVLHDATSRTYETAADLDINLESTRLTARHALEPRLVYDFTAGGRIKGNLGFGFAITYAKGQQDAQITGGIPHPFFFNRPRTLSASAAFEREDLALHTHGLWLIPMSERFQMTLFGGPTWFRVKQETLASVEVEDDYPFDTVTLGEATRAKRQGSKLGLNVGFDASFFFSRHVGVHGLVRHSQATVDLESNTGSLKAGGLQAGAGLRIRY